MCECPPQHWNSVFSFLAVAQLSVLGISPTFLFDIPFKQKEGSVPWAGGQAGAAEVCTIPTAGLLVGVEGWIDIPHSNYQQSLFPRPCHGGNQNKNIFSTIPDMIVVAKARAVAGPLSSSGWEESSHPWHPLLFPVHPGTASLRQPPTDYAVAEKGEAPPQSCPKVLPNG